MSNPCFECQKALGGCSWSRSFTPIPGWDASPGGAHGGYIIRSCPEFVKDAPRRASGGILSEEESRRMLNERMVKEEAKRIGVKSSWAMAVDAKSRRRHKR